MKFKSLFCALLAGLTLSACSNEDGIKGGDDQNTDQAYVTISLRNAGALTRGTAGGNENGIAAENAVNTAEFYFYNADGTYNQHVGKALEWNDATGNVEKIANATVVLQNLKKVGKPKYVVCVLNATPKAYENKTLAQLKEELLNSYLNGAYFIMSNSTYNNGDAASLNFATVIKDENFLKEKPTPETLTTANAVQIYVERVASKIEVGVASSLLTDGKISLGNYDVDGTTQNITIKVLGWGINALNKTSYVEKRVPATWDNLGDFAWDAKDLFRSYWACSPNYNGGEYPASFADGKASNNELETAVKESSTLKYVSWNSLAKNLGEYDYCLENTNTKNELESGNFKAKVTHVLLKAQTEAGTDLISYDGRLYTLNKFMARVLGQLNLSAYKVTTDGSNTTYTQIGVGDLRVVNTYDGTVTVGLTDDAKAATWSSTTGTTTPLTAEALATQIANVKIEADYYKEGMMYYCIPVEHLRGGKFSVGNDLKVTVNEADYGVVRNHYYKINITSIKNLGTAVYNPDEEIVPNMEPQTYFVGAQVNILSWKVVNQSVEL